MSRRTYWLLVFSGVAVWSLLTWGAYALITGASGVLVANADLLGGGAEVQYWTQWALQVFESVGVIVVWVVWAIGAALLVGGAAFGARAWTVLRGLQRSGG